MASKLTATRSSTRNKTNATAIPTATGTRTTRARTKVTSPIEPAPTPPPTTVKKSIVRKPLAASKTNSLESVASSKPSSKSSVNVTKATKLHNAPSDSDREPIMAYLRIRPRLNDDEPESSPYLTPLSDTTVTMIDPQDPQSSRSKYRISTIPPASSYTFSHVFPPNTTQSDFFTKTTLPLVKDVLFGQNALLFTYGVTNSGKTYTVQGGTDSGTAGILPRSLDVIFNSIEGLHGDGRYRPVRLHAVEVADDTDMSPPPTMPEPSLAKVLESLDNSPEPDFAMDPTTIDVDRNYDYTVWLSYAEVYNEKVYDLLASVKDESVNHPDGPTTHPLGSKSLLITRQALALRACPGSDLGETESTGKYIHGLRQFRVHSSSQAKALVKLGQLHRRVFGTLANRESSRSHGMVIIKVVRGHRGDRNDPTSLQVSRLTLVDLAGSERTKHTHTTGDRLKEAGNINKSLMVLGQCMEVMRSNQRKIALSLSQEISSGRMDTKDVKKTLSVVPFRHSKLTESLMDYFIGDGRTVMIVNVNPYDTGYDENSHVMKFAALAREVYITPAPAQVQKVPVVGPGKLQGNKIKQLGPLSLRDPEIVPHPYSRKVTLSMGGAKTGKKAIETVLEVREEDEPQTEHDKEDDDEPINPLVDALFDEVENLRLQLFEAEMRCAIIEADTREEVMREMEERMRAMEAMYTRRLMSEFEQNELKTDAKIDMLHQSGLFGSPVKGQRRPVPALEEDDDYDDSQDVEMSLVAYGPDEDDTEEEGDKSTYLSPLAPRYSKTAPATNKRKSSVAPQPIIEKRPVIPDPPMLPSDDEEAELTDADDDAEMENEPISAATTSSRLTEDSIMEDEDEDYTEEDEDAEEEEDDEEEEHEPEPEPEPPSKPLSSAKVKFQPVRSNQRDNTPSTSTKSTKSSRVSELAHNMDSLNIDESDDDIILSPKPKSKSKSKKVVESEEEDESEEEKPVVKKKKRRVFLLEFCELVLNCHLLGF
ncbi:hypothetical protein CVT24_000470 [Panaeolus cyanescens]|uniref:Kinesin-like protein n=1 Tax=Panaeolus cyanescens TaxID=181874 RepID=A0A409V8C4_9AGAR|nr:hypothetical protein CVT24_000470 [Panaeolus cyanescens]